MVPKRIDEFVAAQVRRSPRFARFLATGTATLLAVLLAVAGAVGAAVAAWHAEWVDVAVRTALAALFAAWSITRRHRPHAGPSRPAT